MGEVYRAHDPKLNRDVAIKVLPTAFSSDAEGLRRCEQEAQATGALNHPNILAIYDVDIHNGSPYWGKRFRCLANRDLGNSELLVAAMRHILCKHALQFSF